MHALLAERLCPAHHPQIKIISGGALRWPDFHAV